MTRGQSRRPPPAVPTTQPTTTTHGDSRSPFVLSSMSERLPNHTVCWGVAADLTTATGVEGSRPLLVIWLAISRTALPPMRKTAVSAAQAASQSTAPAWCAEQTMKFFPRSLSVSGKPADSGAAKTDDTPGTTSTWIPALWRAAISWVIRENTL
eukprot:CAMPEP_0177618012 /NCGR_PEP_ID=MMETSP0419_2-20121207/25288_1 /TAXON_ID=582737 /ORGANISM="Tetraselmis sp., Strain GSL018" /LENGTH=153 /DNA_ID=CAMNT_0019116761 /DNA_START=537 /DNA_END=994 /DNA_ORIENTATION=-